MAQTVSRTLLAVIMLMMGVLHFTADSIFVQIVPPFLPAPYALVWISGVFEAALGLGLLFPRTRKLASYGLVALFVAVFPANIYMAVANVQVHGLPPWLPQPSQGSLWLRLPLQFGFIYWALRAGRADRSSDSRAGTGSKSSASLG
jgi:uncharacterized membrane protein